MRFTHPGSESRRERSLPGFHSFIGLKVLPDAQKPDVCRGAYMQSAMIVAHAIIWSNGMPSIRNLAVALF